MVNWTDGLKLLRWLRKSWNCDGTWGQTTKLSLTYWSHNDGLCFSESRANFSKCSMKMLLTMGDRELPIAIPFSAEELVVYLKICGSQANIQQLMMTSTCKTDHSVSVSSLWELVGLRLLNIGEMTDDVKTEEGICRLEIY
jgi:hypothetical protein